MHHGSVGSAGLPLTITTIIFVGSNSKALYRNYGEPTKMMVLLQSPSTSNNNIVFGSRWCISCHGLGKAFFLSDLARLLALVPAGPRLKEASAKEVDGHLIPRAPNSPK